MSKETHASKQAEKENKTFAEISKEAYEVLKLFQDYPNMLRPNYLTAKSKKEIKEFNWNYENFSKELRKGINKDGKMVLEDLGYSVSFFSSMNEQDSCGFLMHVGNKIEKFYNTIKIELPLSLNLYSPHTSEMISNLFERLVQIYMPFFGCISNRVLARKYGKYLEGNSPTMINWINYWSEDIIGSVGIEHIQKIVDEYPEVTFKDGILQIKNTAINVEIESDMKYYNKLHEQLFI